MNIVAITIGVVSSVVGIGGGTMTVPFLNRGVLSIQRAVAISSALVTHCTFRHFGFSLVQLE